MAVTLTAAQLASRLRTGNTADELAEVQYFLGYATDAVIKYAPDAPDTVHNEATRLLASYLYDAPTVTGGDRFANALRNSGAARTLLPYRIHRAGNIADGDIQATAAEALAAAEIVALLEALAGNARLNAAALRSISGQINRELGSDDWQTGGGGMADNAAQVLAKLRTVDGAGSGLDADLLDGMTPAEIAALVTMPTFRGLPDTPAAFGTVGQVPVVNAAEDGLDFADQSGGAGTAQILSRFEAVTTANTTARALSDAFEDGVEIADSDVFANVGAFTLATVAGITTVTVPNDGLFELTAHLKVVTADSTRSVLYMRANVIRGGSVVPNSGTIMDSTYVRAIAGAQTGVFSGTTTQLFEAGDTVTLQFAEEVDTGNTYTIGGADSVVEIVEIPSEVRAVGGGLSVSAVDDRVGVLALLKANNLAELADVVAARLNLGIDLSLLAALGGATFTGPARGLTPVQADDFTTKAYVDGLVVPVVAHANYIGIKAADAVFAASDYTVSGERVGFVIPAYTGTVYLSFAFPDTETIAEVYLYQTGHRNVINVLSSFPTVGAVTLGGSDHTSRTTVDAQTGYGGYTLEMVFA